MTFIARQPNGLLCRYSTISDGVTHYDMTDAEYLAYKLEIALREAKERVLDELKNDVKSFDELMDHMTGEQLHVFLSELQGSTPESTEEDSHEPNT